MLKNIVTTGIMNRVVLWMSDSLGVFLALFVHCPFFLRFVGWGHMFLTPKLLISKVTESNFFVYYTSRFARALDVPLKVLGTLSKDTNQSSFIRSA
jgi:hypothetical protein